MARTAPLAVVCLAALLLAGCNAGRRATDYTTTLFTDKVYVDAVNYYSPNTAGDMALSLGVAATLAHTPADEHVRQWYQDDVRSRSTDRTANFFKQFGEGEYVIAAGGAAILVGAIMPESCASSRIGQ